MASVELTPELAKQILAAAAARGVSVETLLETVIEKAATESQMAPQTRSQEDHFQLTVTPEEWRKVLHEWVNRHTRAAPPLSDYAISRESIYTREDEMR